MGGNPKFHLLKEIGDSCGDDKSLWGINGNRIYAGSRELQIGGRSFARCGGNRRFSTFQFDKFRHYFGHPMVRNPGQCAHQLEAIVDGISNTREESDSLR